MCDFPVFLSVVLVARNEPTRLLAALERLAGQLEARVSEYEIVVVDNGSQDDSVELLREAVRPEGLPNVQVFALAKEVPFDTAAWAGVEHALGDFVVVLDLLADDVAVLPRMFQEAARGHEAVFARNLTPVRSTFAYALAARAFDALYRGLNGVRLSTEAPQYRMLSRAVVNFIQRHASPELAYRHLPATAGFSKAYVEVGWTPLSRRPRRLLDSVDRGLQLLVTSNRHPMRLVTALALVGAVGNALYSLYVVGIALFKEDVAPGWTTLSLQQSGMFFLFSLVLLVLGEYIARVVSVSAGGPAYHVAREFSSTRIAHRERLNVEASGPAVRLVSPAASPGSRDA